MTRIFSTQAADVGSAIAAGNTTGCKTLVIQVTWFNGGTLVSVTDNKGNSFTPLTAIGDGTSIVRSQILYVVNPVVGAGHQITVTVSGSGSTIIVYGYDDTIAGVDDANNVNNFVVGTTAQAGSLTPTVNGCLLIASLGLSNSGGAEPYSIDSGFTLSEQIPYAGGHFGAGMADLIQGALAAENPTWTVGASRNLLVQLVAFAPGVPVVVTMNVTKILGSAVDAPSGLSVTKIVSAVTDHTRAMAVTKIMVAVVLGDTQTFPFVLRVTDKFGCTAEKACQITIGLD